MSNHESNDDDLHENTFCTNIYDFILPENRYNSEEDIQLFSSPLKSVAIHKITKYGTSCFKCEFEDTGSTISAEKKGNKRLLDVEYTLKDTNETESPDFTKKQKTEHYTVVTNVIPDCSKASNTRGRTISRCVLTKSELPEKLVAFLMPRVLKKSNHMYEKDITKGPYQGVTPYLIKGQQQGWGAQLQNKQRKQMIRIGTFDDIDVAALTFTASYIDNRLIDEPLKARDWIETMCKPESHNLLDMWIKEMS